MSEATIRAEEYKVEGDASVHKVKELVQEGNIRRINIKNEEGEELIWARSGWSSCRYGQPLAQLRPWWWTA